ncbi:MAG: S8 family serine peptidase [Phycisphaerae bacterium]|nr:S8 family serine peptidase [Phycisphaerae bacterium]
MAHSGKRTFSLCLIVCTAVILTAGTAFAGDANETLQPQGLNYAGIYALKQLDPNLTGSGVKFAVLCRSNTYIDGEPQNDYRPAIEHSCFKNKQINLHDDGELAAGISPHSTAVCSILLGEDPNAFNSQLGQFHYQGVAPQASADNYEFWYFLTNNIFPYSPPDVDIITASFGTQFEDWWTRGIESMVEHEGLIVVAGIGNGSNAYDPLLYPGAGSNAIGVGVINSVNAENLAAKLANFALPLPENSSVGPTSKGQCKPDIVAPGNCLAADTNDPNNYEPTGNWSSFSTPIVAGTIGLLVQKAKEDPDLSAAVAKDGGNCVIKAILLNSATKLPFWHKGKLDKDDDHESPLDYIQGAGMLNATGAYKLLTAGQAEPNNVPATGWDNNQLKGEVSQNIYKITVADPNEEFITATLVWNKHYSDAYPFEAMPDKDVDLRLELWAVDINEPNNSYLLDYSDSRVDNVEHIYARADANYTHYELVVTSTDLDDTIDQRYGLAWLVTKKQVRDILWYDLNADGVVNDADLTALVDGAESSNGYMLGDINGDGAIDKKDFRIILAHKNDTADWLATE